jgi:hypothetical protein
VGGLGAACATLDNVCVALLGAGDLTRVTTMEQDDETHPEMS